MIVGATVKRYLVVSYEATVPTDFDLDFTHRRPLAANMFSRQATRVLSGQSRLFSTTAARHHKVAVLGAGGGIGQPLSLLLKTDPHVSSLSLYDIRGAPGVAADVSHIDTPSEVSAISSNCIFIMLKTSFTYR